MGFDDFDNPYRAPEVPFEVVRESAPRGAYFWVRLWISLQMLVAVVGTFAAFIDVHTIVATGPILSMNRPALRWRFLLDVIDKGRSSAARD
jgi:hypothetical protein